MSNQTEELMEEIFPPTGYTRDVRDVMKEIGKGIHIDDKSPYLQKKAEEQHQDITSREQFYIWLATPQFLRNPQQKKALAKKLNVSTKTLDSWEKDLGEYDSKLFFLANKVSIDRAILKKAKEGSFYHAKLAKELSGEYTPKQEVTHKVLSADDIDRIDREAAERIDRELNRIQGLSEPNLLLK